MRNADWGETSTGANAPSSVAALRPSSVALRRVERVDRRRLESFNRPHPGAARCHRLPEERMLRAGPAPWPSPKSLAAEPHGVFKQALSFAGFGFYKDCAPDGAGGGHRGRFRTAQLLIANCGLRIGGTGKPQRAQRAQSIRGWLSGWGARRGIFGPLWLRELSNVSL